MAKGELTPSAARARPVPGGSRRETGPLVGRTEAARILDIAPRRLSTLRDNGRFLPAIVFGETSHAWLREDIEALARKQPLPERDLSAERRNWLTLSELAVQLDTTERQLRSRVRHERWHLVPRPTHWGQFMAWHRDDISAWQAAQRPR